MPAALYFTEDPAACKLLAEDPFALLVGFAIDQQVTVQKAFAGPQALKDRVGTLDPKKLCELDLAPAFAEKPAIHRFPGAMAERVRELARACQAPLGVVLEGGYNRRVLGECVCAVLPVLVAANEGSPAPPSAGAPVAAPERIAERAVELLSRYWPL